MESMSGANLTEYDRTRREGSTMIALTDGWALLAAAVLITLAIMALLRSLAAVAALMLRAGAVVIAAMLIVAALAGREASHIPQANAPTLTMTEARPAYQALIDPVNHSADAVNADLVTGTSIAKIRADLQSQIIAEERLRQQLAMRLWPVVIQPYVTAMTLTDIPDAINCDTTAANSASLTAAEVVLGTTQSCTAWRQSGNRDAIVSLLGLLPAS
jgi:hypothetical protein